VDHADLAVLESLIDLCRRKGVAAVEWQGVKVAMGTEPVPNTAIAAMRAQNVAVAAQQGINASRSVQDAIAATATGRELTDEEILFASVRGWPIDGDGPATVEER